MNHTIPPSKRLRRHSKTIVKGLGNSIVNVVKPIPYRVIVENADWTPYFGSSVEERQKYGRYDTNDCAEFSPIKNIEIQMNALLKRGEFTDEAVAFFKGNGIIGKDGFFNISDQFYDALSGNFGNGGTAEQYCQIIQKYGIIPHDMLFCKIGRASCRERV